MLNNDLLLLSGNDIPFIGGHINIHQPRLKEIAYIGEKVFHTGHLLLLLNKDILLEEDKSVLGNYSNFDIFMAIMNDKVVVKQKSNILMVLTLIFPNVKIKIEKDKILLQQENNKETSINELNFDEFQNIIHQMFDSEDTNKDYNPADEYAERIAKKLKKRQKKIASQKREENNDIKLFSRYISILAVGLKKNINDLMDYTVYQLYDEFKRFQLKQDFDIYLKAKIAGADLEEVENWMEDIHP